MEVMLETGIFSIAHHTVYPCKDNHIMEATINPEKKRSLTNTRSTVKVKDEYTGNQIRLNISINLSSHSLDANAKVVEGDIMAYFLPAKPFSFDLFETLSQTTSIRYFQT